MDGHHDHYLTIWYGVYEKSTRTLTYAGAGHPPALAFTGDTTTRLPSHSLPVGMFADTHFTVQRYRVPAGARILLYSDGAYEFEQASGPQLSLAEFSEICAQMVTSPDFSLDVLISRLSALNPADDREDDCSLVLAVFD